MENQNCEDETTVNNTDICEEKKTKVKHNPLY